MGQRRVGGGGCVPGTPWRVCGRQPTLAGGNAPRVDGRVSLLHTHTHAHAHTIARTHVLRRPGRPGRQGTSPSPTAGESTPRTARPLTLTQHPPTPMPQRTKCRPSRAQCPVPPTAPLLLPSPYPPPPPRPAPTRLLHGRCEEVAGAHVQCLARHDVPGLGGGKGEGGERAVRPGRGSLGRVLWGSESGRQGRRQLAGGACRVCV
mgnify:CR=1 FL=1